MRERRARRPVIQDADSVDVYASEWETMGAAEARHDPSLVRDDDGDLAHEFWRAVPTGGFEVELVAARAASAEKQAAG